VAYYGDNYDTLKRHYHWKFSGVPESFAANGALTEAALTQWVGVGTAILNNTGMNANAIAWEFNALGIQQPGDIPIYSKIAAVNARAILRKSRSRQTRLCAA